MKLHLFSAFFHSIQSFVIKFFINNTIILLKNAKIFEKFKIELEINFGYTGINQGEENIESCKNFTPCFIPV
jgi:hypothetical protein